MDQKEKYPLTYVYPPQPFTVRGLATSIDVNPICKKLVYCVSNIVVVRSTEDFTKCTVFDLHKFETTAVRISPNGNLCASADVRGNVFLWEINAIGHPVNKTFENVLGGAIKDIAWTGDGQRLVFAGEGKTYYAKGILIDTGSSLGDITGLAKPLFCCDLRQQRPFRLAVGGEEFLIGFYEGPPFKFKKSSKQHNNYVMCLRYNKNGEYFVTGSSDRKLFLYQGLDCNELKEIKSAKPHERTVTGLSWFDDSTFATSSNDCTVKIWTIQDDENLLKTLRVAEKPHEIDDMQVAVAELEGDVLAFSLSGSLNQWKNAKAAEEGALPTKRFHGHSNLVGAIVYDAVHNFTISGDNNGKIIIFTETKEAVLPSGQGHTKIVVGIALNSDSSKLYSLGGEELKRTDLTTHTYEKTVECKGQTIGLVAAGTDPLSCFVLLENNLIFKFTDLVQSREYKLDFETSTFGISSDDKFLFVGDKLGFIHQIDTESGKEVQKYALYSTRVTAITVGKGQSLLLAGDTTGKIRLWNYDDQKELSGDRWVHHTTIISSLSFTASHKQVVSTGQDNKFTIYDVATASKVGEKLNAHRRGIITGMVTPSGQIVTSGGDNAVKVWQPADPLA